MKILMLCTRFSLEAASPTLADELAGELARQGHSVTVQVADWANDFKGQACDRVLPNAVHVIIEAAMLVTWLPLRLRRLLKWLLSSLLLARTSWILSRKLKPDLVVAFSPLTALYLPVWLLTRPLGQRRFLVQWDFFPDSHVQNKVLHGARKIRILRMLESYLMRRFDRIGCMSPRNLDYLREYCNIAKENEGVHLPLWTSAPPFPTLPRDIVRTRLDLPPNASIFVFGGQFIPGRGIEDILIASRALSPSVDNVLFLFIGSGPMAHLIDGEIAKNNPFVHLIGGLPRTEYLQVVSACDVGIVCTVRDVTVPTFPSKSMDYLLAGLPILASVEASTDFGNFVESNGVGRSVLAGDTDAFVAAVRAMAAPGVERSSLAAHCKNCLTDNFSVGKAAAIVTGSPELMRA